MDDPAAQTTVVVPLRSFALAKARLAEVLAVDERARLVREMAEGVVRAAAPRAVLVVSPDPAVRDWAQALGAAAVADLGTGLDRAAQIGADRAGESGAAWVAVVAADLPFPDDLGPVLDQATTGPHHRITLVPDQRGDGTNVCVVPATTSMEFSYGPGSFARHRAAGHRAGLDVAVVEHPDLGFDLDLPSDLATLRTHHAEVACALGVEP